MAVQLTMTGSCRHDSRRLSPLQVVDITEQLQANLAEEHRLLQVGYSEVHKVCQGLYSLRELRVWWTFSALSVPL